MAKHRAPTQVTIASTEDETPLHQFVERYWKLAVGAAVVLVAAILLVQWRSQASREVALQSWGRLGQDVTFPGGFFGVGIDTPSATVLAGLAEELEGEPAGPWAKALEVGELLRQEDYDGAQRALEELEQTWPNHPLASDALFPQEDGPPRRLREHVAARIAALETWEANHPELFKNPPLPEGSPRVRLVTSAGVIEVGLYEGLTPQHVHNFLKLCEDGFYDGTSFHRIVKDFMIQGGDPNTREGESDTWGQGGPGYTVAPETGSLWHFEYVLAAAKKPGETESNGSQFYITTGTPHHLDGEHTVFGVVLSGFDVVEAIQDGTVLGETPQEPVVIESTEIL